MLIVVFSFFSGFLGTWVVSRYAEKIGFVDVPNERSSHSNKIPKGGGIGILLGLIIYLSTVGRALFFLWPAVALSLVSLVGDREDLSPRIRLFVHFFMAGITVYLLSAQMLEHFQFFFIGPQRLLWLQIILVFVSIIFIVGTANFYNFMDGINGIAGISGVVGFGLLGTYGVLNDREQSLILLNFVLAGSCVGFLPLNIPKAKVFMGDVGSILLGFLFAIGVVTLADSLQEFVILCSFLFPFYADELITMAERVRSGQNLSQPHRTHLYQVLANEARITHWKVSAGYGGVQLIVGTSVWALAPFGVFVVFLFLLCAVGVFYLVNCSVKKKFMIDRK